IDLERAIALSEALLEDVSWGVVLVDVDLRPTVVNAYAARALGGSRTGLLGRPLGELVVQGVEELEAALAHVLAEGAPGAPAEFWVTLRTAEGERRRCWRSGFLRLASPLTEEPVPLGVGWMFRDVTARKLAQQEADRLRFRTGQLHRAARTVSECEDPMEAATSLLDFALAGFADHVLLDLMEGERLVRTAATPADAPGPCHLDLAHGGRPFDELIADARSFIDWYRVGGFYLARCPTERAELPAVRRLTGTLHALLAESDSADDGGRLVLGHGAHPHPGYAEAADQLVTFRGAWTDYRWSQVAEWTAGYAPGRFAHFVHGVPRTHLDEAMRIARWQGAGTIFFTDRGGQSADGRSGQTDPFAALPRYWDEIVSRIGPGISE
ncbi:spherulation-specific family 4 protein, partial [Streptomyces rubiginosohelvolus]|uniref:PAS domain-containing protein n=1 Tax=Streptomyces rubiginosohelvolus TaxID=67362 RepID=UPI0033D35E69